MQKAVALFFILFFGLSALLFAQDDSEPDVEPDWNMVPNNLYSRGDQLMSLSLGVGFPILFINDGEEKDHNIDPPVGGSGTISYSYYLNSYLFTGGEANLLFFSTIGGNTVYIISFGAKVGTQLILGKFEFPIFLGLGASIQTYLDFGYFGYYMKAGVSAFFRATNQWSFGLTSSFCWYPEWTDDPSKNIDGFFVDVTLTARYHF